MGTKTVRLERGVYERVKERKREDETFSEAIERIMSDYTLMDFAGDTSDEGVTEMDAAFDRLEKRGEDEMEDLKR